MTAAISNFLFKPGPSLTARGSTMIRERSSTLAQTYTNSKLTHE
jgi:hypothetical protein